MTIMLVLLLFFTVEVFTSAEKVIRRSNVASFLKINRHYESKLAVASDKQIKQLLVKGEGECMMECLRDSECVSMNLEDSAAESKSCHLLKADVHREGKASLVKDIKYTHCSIPVSILNICFEVSQVHSSCCPLDESKKTDIVFQMHFAFCLKSF